MIDYAKWLGMDLEKEKDLMWIAREGLKAPLPDNWKPCKAPDTGDIYYFNFQTGESVWDHPCDEYYKNLYATEKANLEKRAAAERARPATAAVARPGTATGIRPGTAVGGLRPATSAGANPLDKPRLGSLAPLGGGLNPLDRPVTAARPLGGVPASVGMRMDNGGDDSDGGSEGSMGGFGGIDSPSAARAPGSSAEVWRAEEDAADGAARDAYTAKLSTAREAWEKELEKEDANARRRRELERDKEQLRLDQEEAKVRREMEERFERVALELKKASVRREEEAEATATAKEKEAESRTKEAEELLRLAAEKIADAKAKSAAAAAIVAESEGSVHAQTERSVKFLDAEKARLSKEEEDNIRGEIEPEISALRAKLEAERDALKRQAEDAAKETARAKTNDEAGGRIAALMAATESHVIPEIEEMHVKAAQSSAQRRIEMAEARAQAAEEEARHRISDAEEAVIAADKQAMDAINAAKAQERSVPYASESEDEGFTIKRKSPSRGSGRSSRTSARGLDSDSDGDDSDGGFESLRGDEERTIERFDPDENPAIASPGGKINVASLRSAVAAGRRRDDARQGALLPPRSAAALGGETDGDAARELGMARGGDCVDGTRHGRGSSREAPFHDQGDSRGVGRVDVGVHGGDARDAGAEGCGAVRGVHRRVLARRVLVDDHGEAVGSERV
jgi:centrosomal protein CEP164